MAFIHFTKHYESKRNNIVTTPPFPYEPGAQTEPQHIDEN